MRIGGGAPRSRTILTAETRPDGSDEIRGVIPGAYRIVAALFLESPAWADAAVLRQLALVFRVAFAATASAQGGLPAAPEGTGRIAGVVTRGDTGQPIAGATIRMVQWVGGLGDQNAARTDARGRFEFPKSRRLVPTHGAGGRVCLARVRHGVSGSRVPRGAAVTWDPCRAE